MTLGERIAYYRKKAGYSQEGLAERLGVSRQDPTETEGKKPKRFSLGNFEEPS